MSTKTIAAQVQDYHNRRWKTFRQQQYYPYRKGTSFKLEVHPRKAAFRQWILKYFNRNEDYMNLILLIMCGQKEIRMLCIVFNHRFSLNDWERCKWNLFGTYFFPPYFIPYFFDLVQLIGIDLFLSLSLVLGN